MSILGTIKIGQLEASRVSWLYPWIWEERTNILSVATRHSRVADGPVEWSKRPLPYLSNYSTNSLNFIIFIRISKDAVSEIAFSTHQHRPCWRGGSHSTSPILQKKAIICISPSSRGEHSWRSQSQKIYWATFLTTVLSCTKRGFSRKHQRSSQRNI